MSKKKIIVLFSGKGSNLQNLIHVLPQNIEIVATITNKPNAGGITKANHANIPVYVLEHTGFHSREAFDDALVTMIQNIEHDLVVLAGFMRILTPNFTNHIRSINLHPSLLPLFKGAKAIEKSFESDEKEGGVSVHWVSSELDGGEIILQKAVAKEAHDTLDSFTTKIQACEYELLPLAIEKILLD